MTSLYFKIDSFTFFLTSLKMDTPSSTHHPSPRRIKHDHNILKKSRARERFFKYFEDQDFIELKDQSFIAHCQARQASYLDLAFQSYLYTY